MTQIYRFDIATELVCTDPETFRRIVRDRLERMGVGSKDAVVVTVQPSDTDGFVEVMVYQAYDERHSVARIVGGLILWWARKMMQ